MKPAARRRARECALQALYSWQLSNNDIADVEYQFLAENDVKDVDGFSLILDGATNVDKAYGGFVPDGYKATVSNNFLLMKNSSTTGNVAGGFSQSTHAVKNHATLTDSTVEGNVYGGYEDTVAGNGDGGGRRVERHVDAALHYHLIKGSGMVDYPAVGYSGELGSERAGNHQQRNKERKEFGHSYVIFKSSVR